MNREDIRKKFEEGGKSYSEIKKTYGRFFKRVVVEDYNNEPEWGKIGHYNSGMSNGHKKLKRSDSRI